VSKQDSQFFNTFSIVIGLLVAVTLVLMALARIVGRDTQAQHVLIDPKNVAAVERNLAPLVRVAVAGQDNSALAIAEEAPQGGAPFALAVPQDGPSLYEAACKACHDQGIGGAPKTGDKAAWAPRIAQGKDTLYKHALEGYTGKAGVMPPKGGRIDLSDDLIRLGVDHLVDLNR
jgi:cytochrome c5